MQIKFGATSADLMCIDESKEDEVEEQHFVEAQIVQKDAREENVLAKEEQLPTKVQLKVHQSIKV
jgi:hypothetical protein